MRLTIQSYRSNQSSKNAQLKSSVLKQPDILIKVHIVRNDRETSFIMILSYVPFNIFKSYGDDGRVDY